MYSAEEQFIRSLESLPAAKVLNTVEHECRAFESVKSGKSKLLSNATNAILVFRQFLNAVMLGVPIAPCSLTCEHLATFRRTIVRLVEDGMLPQNATEEFDNTFSALSA